MTTSNNLRTFYACQAINIAVHPITEEDGAYTYQEVVDNDFSFVHGVQSVGINSSFDFENLFELGQLEIYDAVLNLPEVEITIEKIFDGHKTVYGTFVAGTDDDVLGDDAPEGILLDTRRRAAVRFGIYKDTGNAGETDAEVGVIECTGMYVSNVTYTFPVDGNPTESVTLVGNHKAWYTDGSKPLDIPAAISDNDDNTIDEPTDGAYTGGEKRIARRQDITYDGPGSDKAQNVTISIDLTREDLFEFGEKLPYARIPPFPIEATGEVESLAVDGSFDDIQFSEDTNELPEREQTLKVTVGSFEVELTNAFLTSIAHGGGDATGGNATVTRSYTAYNVFKVSDSGDYVAAS